MRRTAVVDDIEVDIQSIYAISHDCNSAMCGRTKCCCARYEICISSSEMSTIIGYMPDALQYAGHLSDESGFDNVFDQLGTDLYAIDTDDDDLCVFAYSDIQNNIRCSLHSAALKLGLSPHEVKPGSCVTWPLALSERKPFRLSIANDAFDFPCNTFSAGSPAIDPNIERIIQNMFGEEFLMKMKRLSI